MPQRSAGSDRLSALLRTSMLTSTARTVLRRRYLRRDADGQIVETPDEMFRRVAAHLAQAEPWFGGTAARTEERFCEAMRALEFLPNAPTLMNAGTTLNQLAAHDVSPERHLQVQAMVQRHLDNAVSKTVNLSTMAPKDEVRAGVGARRRPGGGMRSTFSRSRRGTASVLVPWRAGGRREMCCGPRECPPGRWRGAGPLSMPQWAWAGREDSRRRHRRGRGVRWPRGVGPGGRTEGGRVRSQLRMRRRLP